MAEIELSRAGPAVPGPADRDRRRSCEREVAAWEEERNERAVEVKWQFTTADARIKLRRLYPTTQ